MKHFRYVGYLIFIAMLLIGCSDSETEAEEQKETNDLTEQVDEKEEDHEENVQKDEELEPYTTRNVEEIMQLAPGTYGEDKYDESKIKEEIAAFPTELSADDYFTRLLALTADDYRQLYDQIAQFDITYADPNKSPDGSVSGEMAIPLAKEVNVAILLDASGSMRGEIEGRTKMEHAVLAIESFVSMLPSSVNVSLQVYGHEGTGEEQDKSLSCESTEVVYPLAPYNEEQFNSTLHEISPAGWTPLAASITKTYDDLESNASDGAENIVYIVSDGIETCDGDPVEEAKKLNESNVKAIVNIIGFDVDDAGQKELKEVAEAGEGKYMTVTSQQEIEDFFNSEKRALEKEWLSWQSENVSNYYGSEREMVDHVHDLKNDIYEKANNEMEKLLALVEIMPDIMDLDANTGRELAKAVRNRSNDIRVYARDKEQQYRKEIQEQGKESRQDVRERAEEGREQLETE